MDNTNLPIVEGRRSFLGQCAALAGIAVVGCGASLLQGCEASTSPPQRGGNGGDLVLDVSSLDADGKSMVTTQHGSDGKRIVVVRNAATEYIALSLECTHEQYEVNPPGSDGLMTCIYHGSKFDLTGAVKVGPATAPLKRYTTTFDSANKKLTIKLA